MEYSEPGRESAPQQEQSKNIQQDFMEEVEFKVGPKNELYLNMENILSKEIRIQTHLYSKAILLPCPIV